MRMWELHYSLMKSLPSRLFQRAYWLFLRKLGIANRLCDEGFFKLQLLAVTGEKYDTKTGGINSWILWQRLNFKSDIVFKACDKYAVRKIVQERIGPEYLVPLVKIGDNDFWENPDDIDFDKLPESFVLKLNNGSGMNLIVKDKNALNWKDAKAKMRRWLSSDYANNSRENQYAAMDNKIICEEMIPTISGEPPEDYKIMCSDGKPLYCWVDTARFTNHKRNVFTTDWVDEGVIIAYNRAEQAIPKPKNFELMLELAAKMSKGIPIVRVDFYNVDGNIYFGEMTFTSDCAIAITKPFAFSQRMARHVNWPN